MAQSDPLFQLLYVSELAPGCGFEVVKEIVSVARAHNPAQQVTGALLFDGERFCQLLEGSQAAVQALMQRIERDPRHTAVQLLFAGEIAGPRAVQRWLSGYCGPHQLDAFSAPTGLRERAAVDAFVSVLRSADTE